MQTSAPPIDLMPMAVASLAWKQDLERGLLERRADDLREVARLLQSAPICIHDITLLSGPRSRASHREGFLSDDILISANGLQGIEPVTHSALINVGMKRVGTGQSGSLYEHQQERWMLFVAWLPSHALNLRNGTTQ